MKKSIFRNSICPMILGLALGVIVILTLANPFASVSANEGSGGCPDSYGNNGPCTGGYCFVPLDGSRKYCKYFESGCGSPTCTP